MHSSERRKYPRIVRVLPCRIRLGASGIAAQTRNISCSGLLCKTPRLIPPMTKLGITLELPDIPGKIHCDGVVVRQDKQEAESKTPHFLTAIYFSKIKDEDRKKIAEFVLKSMLAYTNRRS